MSAKRTVRSRSCASSSHGETLPSWSRRVTTISSPALSVRPTVRESAKLSVVMFAPKIASSGSHQRNDAALSRACVTSASLRRLLPKCPPRFAFDSRRYAAIASTTESGHCVPPGPSRKAVGPCNAVKRARTASTSSAVTATEGHYPVAREHSRASEGAARPRRTERPRPRVARDRAERRPQHLRRRRVRALVGPPRRRLLRRDASRESHPQLGAGGRVVGRARAGGAVLGAARRPQSDDGSARAILDVACDAVRIWT